MNELIEWLNHNKIQYSIIDQEVLELPGMGRLLFEDMEQISSLFRTASDGTLEFNAIEDPKVLENEGINYIVFKFGNNWYYTDVRKDFALNILKYVGERQPSAVDVPFVNLGVHTPYELLNGSFMPKEWCKKAKYLGHKAIGVCDKNTMASLYNLQQECVSCGITPVFGYSLTVSIGNECFDGKVYAQTQCGLRNLLRIQKAIMVDSENKTISLDELINRAKGNVFVFGKLSSDMMIDRPDVVKSIKDSFEDVFYQVDLAEYKAERIDIAVLNATKSYFDHMDELCVQPVLIGDCYYLDKDDAKNKIILNKIAEGAAHEQSDDQYFKDVDEHFAVFEQLFDSERWDVKALFELCCVNTVRIANGAIARFENTRNFMPKYDMTDEEKVKYGTTHNMFIQLLEDGLQRLIPECDRERYRKQMEYEIYIIESTNNIDYLLVQYDTVNWCRRNNIQVGCGRGSAAGSLLLYLLGITLVDPIRFDLIFERFLLPERAGLYAADTTVFATDVESTQYIELDLANNSSLLLDKDAELLVKREGSEAPIRVYADELKEGDDILFDNRDELFTLTNLQQ